MGVHLDPTEVTERSDHMVVHLDQTEVFERLDHMVVYWGRTVRLDPGVLCQEAVEIQEGS